MKKGNLSLSINSIVVLILAITMLGLGLGFMKKTFGGATDQFDQVSEEMRKEMSNKMKGISKSVDLDVYEIDVPKGKEKTVYLGIKNEVSEINKFTIEYDGNCIGDGVKGGGDLDSNVIINHRNQITVQGMDVGIIPIILEGESTDTKCKITFNVYNENKNKHGSIILYASMI